MMSSGHRQNALYRTGDNLRLSRSETVLLATQFGLAFLLQLTPVLQGMIGRLVLPVMAGLAWLSPISGFFFIAAGQALPYPEGIAFNPAQIGFITFPVVVAVRYQRIALRGIQALLLFLPWMLWHSLVSRGDLTVFLPGDEYMKSLYYAVMACYLVNVSGGGYRKCLLGLCLGGLSVTLAFWGNQAGFPIELSDFGGMRGDFARLGGVRADSVMVWPPLLMGMFGILGLSIAVDRRSDDDRSARRMAALALGVVTFGIVPLVATMTHSALVGFVLMVLAFGGVYFDLVRRGRIGFSAQRRFRQMLSSGIVILSLFFGFDVFEVRSRVLGTRAEYEQQSEQMGVAASRTEVWRASLKNISQYPLFGVRFSGGEIIPVRQYGRDYVAHNVFLDAGRGGGVPGMLLMWWFFWKPAVRMWRSPHRLVFVPYLLAHFAMFIFWMTLSFQYYKTFWALWMLMAMAVERHGLQRFRVPAAGGAVPTHPPLPTYPR